MSQKKFFGMLTLIVGVMLVFSLIGCDDGTTGDPDPQFQLPVPDLLDPYIGETLDISEQVFSESNGTIIPFNGNLSVSSWRFIDGTANINNGRLSFTVGTPSPLVPIADILEDGSGSWYKNFRYSITDVQSAYLYDGELDGNQDFSWLEKRRDTDYSFEHVSYIYVDKDVTVTAEGKVVIDDGYTTTSADIILELKRGWNAAYFRMASTDTTHRNANVIYCMGETNELNWILY